METGNLFGRLLESSKGGLMVAWTKIPEVEMVRWSDSRYILEIEPAGLVDEDTGVRGREQLSMDHRLGA